MGADKGGTKSGGFFHLFDWNRKSRKKLFSSVSPESTKQEKRGHDKLTTPHLHLVDDDEIVGISSGKGSSEYSCASSVTEEEGIALRAPGVVARLMGLDSMPTSGVSEPSSTPFFDTNSLRDKQSHKRSPEYNINDPFNHTVQRADGYARRPLEIRSQKMPSSPIERFQTEILPRRPAKSLPLTHHKLLSPIKTPGFIPTRDAAHIMEAAAKILDPGNQPSGRTKVSSFGSSSTPLRIRDSHENIMVSQSHRTSRILESARTPIDSNDSMYLRRQLVNKSWNGLEDAPMLGCSHEPIDSNDSRYIRRQPVNKSWNGLEDAPMLGCSHESRGSNPVDAKGKGRSISLAIQAKVNVQRREGLNSSSRSSLIQKEHNECNFNQPFKSQPNNQKSKLQKKSSVANASGVLRQNNQKQNCMTSKSKLSSKQSTSNQHGTKGVAGDASSTKNKSLNKLSGKSKVVNRKDGRDATDFECEGSSSCCKDFPQKKRLIEKGFVCERSRFRDDVLVDRHPKRVQPNVVIDEHSHSRWKEDNRSDGADVVSFTFTSPLIKPTSGSHITTPLAENLDKGNMYCFDTHNQKKDEDATDKKLFSHGVNVISGNALSLLLEQKLRELTSGVEPSYGRIFKAGTFAASSSILQEQVSELNTIDSITGEQEKEFDHGSQRDKRGSIFGYGDTPFSGQVYGASKLQEVEECSPFSVLQASFSDENNQTERLDSTNGSKTCSSSIQAQNNVSLCSETNSRSPETDTDLSDSASSTLAESSDASKSIEQDLDFVKEIISSTSLAPTVDKLNPPLFDKLEIKRSGEGKSCVLRRKLLFDCVNECLELKCSKYFKTGYGAWSKSALFVANESLAKEIYDEISGWKRMGDWMVDELVDKDMSSHGGKWLDYDVEAFEAGSEIGREIVDSLVEELIADCFIKGPCSQFKGVRILKCKLQSGFSLQTGN